MEWNQLIGDLIDGNLDGVFEEKELVNLTPENFSKTTLSNLNEDKQEMWKEFLSFFSQNEDALSKIPPSKDSVVGFIKEQMKQIKTDDNDFFSIEDVDFGDFSLETGGDAGNSFERSPHVLPDQENEDQVFEYEDLRGNDIDQHIINSKRELQFTSKTGINNSLRLIMPKYLRTVEVEDLNRNFWVIAKTFSGIVNYINSYGQNLNEKILTPITNEINKIWGNVLYLWAAIAVLSQEKEEYNDIHTEIISITEDYLNEDLSELNNYFNDNILLDQNLYDKYSSIITNKFQHYKNEYLKSNLVLIPCIKLNNYEAKYYSRFYFPGAWLLDRTLNEDFKIIKFVQVETQWGTGGQNQLSSLLLTAEDEIQDFIYGIRKNSNYYEIKKPLTSNVTYSDERYYGLLIPQYKITAEKQNYLNAEFNISLYDKIQDIINNEVYSLVSYGGTISYNNDTAFILKTKNYLPLSSLSNYYLPIQRGYNQDEMLSYYSLLTWYFKEKGTLMLPPRKTISDAQTYLNEYRKAYNEIITSSIRDDLQMDSQILKFYLEEQDSKNTDILFVTGKRVFNFTEGEYNDTNYDNTLYYEVIYNDLNEAIPPTDIMEKNILVQKGEGEEGQLGAGILLQIGEKKVYNYYNSYIEDTTGYTTSNFYMTELFKSPSDYIENGEEYSSFDITFFGKESLIKIQNENQILLMRKIDEQFFKEDNWLIEKINSKTVSPMEGKGVFKFLEASNGEETASSIYLDGREASLIFEEFFEYIKVQNSGDIRTYSLESLVNSFNESKNAKVIYLNRNWLSYIRKYIIIDNFLDLEEEQQEIRKTGIYQDKHCIVKEENGVFVQGGIGSEEDPLQLVPGQEHFSDVYFYTQRKNEDNIGYYDQ